MPFLFWFYHIRVKLLLTIIIVCWSQLYPSPLQTSMQAVSSNKFCELPQSRSPIIACYSGSKEIVLATDLCKVHHAMSACHAWGGRLQITSYLHGWCIVYFCHAMQSASKMAAITMAKATPVSRPTYYLPLALGRSPAGVLLALHSWPTYHLPLALGRSPAGALSLITSPSSSQFTEPGRAIQ
jgi:hypothetical protein